MCHCFVFSRSKNKRWKWQRSMWSLSSSIFHKNDNNEKIKDTKTMVVCCRLHVWEELKQKVKIMMITNHRLLFFIGMTTWKKKHKKDNYMPSFSCLRRVGIRGEDNNDFYDHHLFFKGTMPRRKKLGKQCLCATIFVSKRGWKRRWKWW